MAWLFYLLGLSIAIEGALHVWFSRPALYFWSGLNFLFIIAIAVTTAFYFNIFGIAMIITCLYRVFNNLRILKGRMHQGYLRRATRRTGYWLATMQFAIAAALGLWRELSPNSHSVWLVFTLSQFLATIVLTLSLRHQLSHTRPPRLAKNYPDVQLPSLTVAIPARNETDDLQICLESLVASNYPKLEIIVLDDCSQNKHTPEIIRSFAHDGVRFIKGEEPKPTWLAKNQAYDQLARQASGEYIVFCGVDVRFAPDSLRQLVSQALSRKKRMISILPREQDGLGSPMAIVQSIRYWWELAPPRRMFRRPAVLSSCWLIERQTLLRAGGFAAVTRTISPEAYFAKVSMFNDGYSFLRSNSKLAIASAKQPIDQRETAIRVRYPQLHRRPEQVFLVTIAEIVFLLAPFLVAFLGGLWRIGFIAETLAILSCLALTADYWQMAHVTGLSRLPFALVGLPVMICSDIVILHRSMWQYEFSEVIWKGRNVCIPVMHAYPGLPKIN